MKLINLGKFNNFTNLKSSAIWGWFPLLINHDSRVRTGFGRYNLPRSISRDTSWFFKSGLHISCHMSMTGNKQIMLSKLEKKTLKTIPTWGCSPRDVDGLYPYVYIYIYIWNIHEYPLYYIWDDIDYMGFVWIINYLLRLNSWYLAIQIQAPRNRQGRHSQDPTSYNPGVFRIRIQRSGHWTLKRRARLSRGSHRTPPSRSGDRRRTSRASQGWGSQPGKAQPFDVRCISYTTCLWSSWIFMVYQYITLYYFIYNIYSTLYIYIYMYYVHL